MSTSTMSHQTTKSATPSEAPYVTDAAVSDSVLAARVKLSLERLGYQQLRAVNCRVDRGDVCLTGRLPSYYLKQIAQTIAMRVPGVYRITNEIEVPVDG